MGVRNLDSALEFSVEVTCWENRCANILAIQLRYDAAGLRPGADAVPAYHELFGYAFCITSRVAGNEVAD